MRELLAIAREPNLPHVVQRVAEVLHLAHLHIVQPQPLHVKETPKAIEGVVARSSTASKAPHPRIALESPTLVHREDQNDSGTGAVGIVQFLLVLPLRCPHVVLHRLHNIFAHIAGDNEEAGLRVLKQRAPLEACWLHHLSLGKEAHPLVHHTGG